jgi:hypothetical protein
VAVDRGDAARVDRSDRGPEAVLEEPGLAAEDVGDREARAVGVVLVGGHARADRERGDAPEGVVGVGRWRSAGGDGRGGVAGGVVAPGGGHSLARGGEEAADLVDLRAAHLPDGLSVRADARLDARLGDGAGRVPGHPALGFGAHLPLELVEGVVVEARGAPHRIGRLDHVAALVGDQRGDVVLVDDRFKKPSFAGSPSS